MQKNTETRALIYALSAVLLWSTVATAFKIALQYHSVISLLTGASITSLASLAIILGFQGKLKEAVKRFPANIKSALLLGLINPVIYYLVLFEAYRRLPAQVAQPVNYTWAIMLALLSVPILKHTLSRKDIAGLVLGYSGVVLISVAGKNVTGSIDAIGLGLALFSTLLWAGFWLINTKQKQDPIISLFHNFIVAVPLLIGLWLLLEKDTLVWSIKATGSVIYVGLFEMGITFALWQMALHHTNNAAKIGTLIFISPFVSLFLISYFLHEPLQVQTFAGLALIILGVWFSQRKSQS
jgi:drug/metabolite transporter (DMT)-like permease